MEFWKKYYGQLVDFHITKVTFEEDEYGGDPWPVLHMSHPDGTDLRITLSADQEGNGAGFAFIEEDN
jgi:hypothetical protein